VSSVQTSGGTTQARTKDCRGELLFAAKPRDMQWMEQAKQKLQLRI
jgi:hypothetical protein